MRDLNGHQSRRAKGVYSPGANLVRGALPGGTATPPAEDDGPPYGRLARHRALGSRSASTSPVRERPPVPAAAPERPSPQLASRAAGDDQYLVVSRSRVDMLERDHRELEVMRSMHGLSSAEHSPQPIHAPTGGTFTGQLAPHHQQQQPQQHHDQNHHSSSRKVALDFVHGAVRDDEAHEAALTQRKQYAMLRAAERNAQEAQRDLVTAQQDLTTVKAELKGVTAKNRQLTGTVTDLRDELARVRAENVALQGAVDRESRLSATKKHEIDAAESSERQLRRELDNTQAENDNLRAEVTRLRNKVLRYQDYFEHQQRVAQRETQHHPDHSQQQQHRIALDDGVDAEVPSQHRGGSPSSARRDPLAAFHPDGAADRLPGTESTRDAALHVRAEQRAARSSPSRPLPSEQPPERHEPRRVVVVGEQQQPQRREMTPDEEVDAALGPAVSVVSHGAGGTAAPSEGPRQAGGPVKHLFRSGAVRDTYGIATSTTGGAAAAAPGSAQQAWPNYSAGRSGGAPSYHRDGGATTTSPPPDTSEYESGAAEYNVPAAGSRQLSPRGRHQRPVTYDGRIPWSRSANDALL